MKRRNTNETGALLTSDHTASVKIFVIPAYVGFNPSKEFEHSNTALQTKHELISKPNSTLAKSSTSAVAATWPIWYLQMLYFFSPIFITYKKQNQSEYEGME